MAEKTSQEYQSFGNFGVKARVEGSELVLSIPLDRAMAKTSASGKMVLTASTGGFAHVPGTDGLKINLAAGYAAG